MTDFLSENRNDGTPWRSWRSWLAATLLGCVTAIATGCAAHSQADVAPELGPLFVHVADVGLGKSMSRIDYQSVDAKTGRLYIAGMGAGKLLVFDIGKQSLAEEREGFPKTTGILAVPALGKLYVSVPGSGLKSAFSVALGWLGLTQGDGKLAILALDSLRELARLPGGVFPDGIAYDSVDARIFVSDEMGEAVQVIDAHSDQLLGRIALGGETGNVQYDPLTGRLYVPVQSKDELAIIDPREGRSVARLALTGGRHPHGLAIAPASSIGYVACDGDDRLLVVDLKAQKVLTVLPLGRDPDVLALDPGMNRLYVASESGQLASFDISAPEAPRALGIVTVGPRAHSVAVDPASHRLYLPLADLNGTTVMRVIAPRQS
jgi:hypothetical protein